MGEMDNPHEPSGTDCHSDRRVDKASPEDWADGVYAAAGVVRAEMVANAGTVKDVLLHLDKQLVSLAENYSGRRKGMDKQNNALDEIRSLGWSVAVHNDYRLNGEGHTFWLFTKDGHAAKGEGRTDAEALTRARAAIDFLDLCVTDREGALRAFRKIGEMTEHDSPVYQVAADQEAWLARRHSDYPKCDPECSYCREWRDEQRIDSSKVASMVDFADGPTPTRGIRCPRP